MAEVTICGCALIDADLGCPTTARRASTSNRGSIRAPWVPACDCAIRDDSQKNRFLKQNRPAFRVTELGRHVHEAKVTDRPGRAIRGRREIGRRLGDLRTRR